MICFLNGKKQRNVNEQRDLDVLIHEMHKENIQIYQIIKKENDMVRD